MLHTSSGRNQHLSRAVGLSNCVCCRYDFTDGDLGVSLSQVRMFLDQNPDIPFRVLRFLVTEINYGGRVTDDKDRRLMSNLINSFLGPEVLDPNYKFSASGVSASP